MFKKLKTKSPQGTRKLGRKMVQEFLGAVHLHSGALVIGLEGDLGSGKTTFVQGFAKGLGIEEKILSPTFVILKKFKITKDKPTIQKFKTFYHIDCYRIQVPKELLDLGFKEIISKPENIVIIEWADRVKKALPKEAIMLKFEFIDEKVREIMLQ